jgi:hypothetical protein
MEAEVLPIEPTLCTSVSKRGFVRVKRIHTRKRKRCLTIGEGERGLPCQQKLELLYAFKRTSSL